MGAGMSGTSISLVVKRDFKGFKESDPLIHFDSKA